MQTKRSGFFYGWVVVAGCVMLRLGLGIPNYSMSVFLIPMCESLDISRAAFSFYSTFSHIMTMVMLPFIGKWFRKYSFKLLLYAGAVMTTIAIFCYSLVSEVWHFYLFSALNGIFSGFLNSVPIAMLMANWFLERRALATSIAFAGSGISAMFVVPLANSIIENSSWNNAFRIIAFIYMVLVFIPVIFLIKVYPSDVGQSQFGAKETASGDTPVSERGITRNQALRTRTFWCVGIAMFLTGFVFMGTQNHVIAYLCDIGFSSDFASIAYSTIMFFDTIGKIGLGLVYEKAGFRRTNIIIFLMFFIAEIVLLFISSAPMALAYAVIMGLCAGIQTGVYPTVINRLMGDKEYGIIYSNEQVMYFVGMALGVPFSGLVFDVMGTYRVAWLLYSAVILLILFLILYAQRMSAKKVEM